MMMNSDEMQRQMDSMKGKMKMDNGDPMMMKNIMKEMDDMMSGTHPNTTGMDKMHKGGK